MTRRKTELKRAQVTISPPGGTRLTLLNAGTLSDQTGPMHRQTLYGVFYEMYRRHPWVRAGVDKRAATAVQAGYQLTPEDPEQDLNKQEAKEFREFARRSNLTQLRRQWYKDIDIFSEGWGWVQPTKGGRPWKAHRLHPKYTFPKLTDGVVTGVEYGTGAGKKFYPIEQLLHFRDEDPDQDVAGLSKMYSLMETVSQDLMAMRYNLSFFENSAQTGIVFNMRNASKEEADRNRLWLEQNYAGAEKAHRPIVLEGDIEVKSSVAKHADMQFIEGRKVLRQEILAVLDVNESLLGINDNTNRSSAKENDVTFRDAIAARQQLIEEEVNNKLILQMFGWDDILFEEHDASKRNQLEQLVLYTQALQNGLMNRNEIRGRLGLGDIEGGDLFTVQTATGMIPVDKLLEQFETAQKLAQQINQDDPDTEGDEDDPNNDTKANDRKREPDARPR